MTATTKRQAAIETAIDEVRGTLTLTFATGETLQVRVEDLSANVVRQATLHGLKQKLCDAAAKPCNPETGRSASLEDKIQAVKRVHDTLLSGQWNMARGEGVGSGGLLFEALCRIQPEKPRETVRAFLESLTPAQKTKLRTKNPRVVEVINEIQLEQAGDVEDGDDILARLTDA